MKKNLLPVLLMSFVLLFFSNMAYTQTTLSAGDLAIIGINTDNPDDFAFVLLKDIEAGTEIRFTDSGWLSTGSFRGNEGAVKFTAATSIAAGTVITYDGNDNFTADNDAIVGTGGFNLSTSGDQVLAFQGASDSPTFVYAAQTNSNQWQADATSSNTSAVPQGLTDGVNCVALGAGSGAGDEYDNAKYNGSESFASPVLALAAISNNSNWVGDDANRYDFSLFGDFTLPVELTSFTAAAGNGKITLRWSTASEVDNQGFAILRSENGDTDYSEMDSYISNNELKGAGNSSHTLNYQYVDNSVINDHTYWYKLVDVDVNGVRTEHGPVQATPKAENTDDPGSIPQAFNLKNYPNPFGVSNSLRGNPGTTISFDLSSFKGEKVEVELVVYDLLGKKVRTLVKGLLDKKFHQISWNGIDDNGHNLPSGVYIYSFRSPQLRQTKKMILMR